jgi:hypothetical protein
MREGRLRAGHARRQLRAQAFIQREAPLVPLRKSEESARVLDDTVLLDRPLGQRRVKILELLKCQPLGLEHTLAAVA